MSTANIIPINRVAPAGFGSRVGRSFPAHDARGVHLGLQPPPQKVQGFDAFTNMAARMGFGTPSLTEATQYNMVRWTYDYWLMITLYRNHWISRKIVDGPAQDMVRAWPRLTSDIEPDDITRIDRVIRKTRVKSQVLDTLKWARLFGGAGALMVIKGHENRLDEPLDYDTIELGAFKGLIPFDRWSGIQPEGVVSSDIEQPLEFNLPEQYRVQTPEGGKNFTVHSSRILRFTGPSVPAPEYQAQQYWGISVLEPAYEEIRKRDNMSWNMLSLSFRASIIGMKFDDLAQMLSGAGMNQRALIAFQQRMESVNQLMSNNSMLLLPKDGGLEQIAVQASGWSDLYQQFQLDIAGAATYPVTRLFGRTLSGLGQSNDADERIYEDLIALEQDDRMRPQLDRLYPVLCMSELGEVPKDLDLTFPSVRVLREEEKADLGSKIVVNVTGLVNAGIMTKAQAMKEIKQSSDVTGFGTNYTDEDIDEAEKQEDLAGELGAAGPGGPGGPGGEEDEPSEPGGKQEAAAAPARKRIIRPQSEEKEKTPARDAFPHLAQLTRTARAFDAGVDPQYGTRHAEFDYCGIPVAVEYQQGTRRQIRNPQDQLVYDRLMKYDYGFIRNTVGRDGDEIDVILGPTMAAPNVYVVDMEDLGQDVDQREDEDKVLMGFVSAEEAERAFLSMYPETFLRGMVEIPLGEFQRVIAESSQFDSGYGTAVALDAEATDAWEESKHSRGQPNNAGQFASKGSGNLGSGSKASKGGAKGIGVEGAWKPPQSKAKLDLKTFRLPDVRIDPKTKKPRDGVPTGWTDVRVNSDPNADVRVIGLNSHGNPTWLGSKSWNEKVKAERAKWPKWAQKLPIPSNATDIVLAPDDKGKYLCSFTDSTGKTGCKKYSPKHVEAASKAKYGEVRKLDKRVDAVYARVVKDRESKNEMQRQLGQVADLIASYGIRPGGGEGQEHTVISDKKRSLFPPWAKKMKVPPGGSDGES